MNKKNPKPELRFLVLTLLVLLGCAPAFAAESECEASGDHGFICGPKNAEDLVAIPGTRWILSSGMAPGAGIYLIDAERKIWKALYPGDAPQARQDMGLFGACPGSPDPNNFVSHGLTIRPGTNGHSTLYVVGHGEREAVEVFDVDANGTRPELIWKGCIMMPESMEANSVASFADGSLLVTIPLHPGNTIADALAGKVTGAVYQWSPGDRGFTMIEGTGLPYGNGVEVSADGREFYVASSGLSRVLAYSNSNPARQLRATDELEIVPDNLHRGSDGSLITAGLVSDDPRCGNVRGPEAFDLGEFASCPRPYVVLAIDPDSMRSGDLARGPANERFSNITMGLPLAGTLWMGTFAGDRIAYRSLGHSE